MVRNLRRSIREDDYLPITVSAQNGNSGEVLTDPFPCHIANISRWRLKTSQGNTLGSLQSYTASLKKSNANNHSD